MQKQTATDGGEESERKHADKNFRTDVDDIVWILENETLTKTGRAKLENLLARGLRTSREAGSPEDEYAKRKFRQYKD